MLSCLLQGRGGGGGGCCDGREGLVVLFSFFFFFFVFLFPSVQVGRDFLFFVSTRPVIGIFTYLDINAPTRAETSNCDHMVLFFLFGGIEFAA